MYFLIIFISKIVLSDYNCFFLILIRILISVYVLLFSLFGIWSIVSVSLICCYFIGLERRYVRIF